MRNNPAESAISNVAFRNLKTAMMRNNRPFAGVRFEAVWTDRSLLISGSESKAGDAAMIYCVRSQEEKVWIFFKPLRNPAAAGIRRSPQEFLPAWRSRERARERRGWPSRKCWP